MKKINKLIKGTILATVTVVAMVFATSSTMAFQGFSIGIVGIDSTWDVQGREEEGRADGLLTSTHSFEYNVTSVTKDIKFPSLFVEYTVWKYSGNDCWY